MTSSFDGISSEPWAQRHMIRGSKILPAAAAVAPDWYLRIPDILPYRLLLKRAMVVHGQPDHLQNADASQTRSCLQLQQQGQKAGNWETVGLQKEQPPCHPACGLRLRRP